MPLGCRSPQSTSPLPATGEAGPSDANFANSRGLESLICCCALGCLQPRCIHLHLFLNAKSFADGLSKKNEYHQ